MNSSVDLQGLAIDRGGTSGSGVKRKTHVWSRYVLPLMLLLGFLSLMAWAAWDTVFPPRPVRVIPVIATTAEVQQEGTPLFNAAGWIEPRPTPVRVAALAPGVVEELLVVEDQPVGKGDPVAELVKDDAKLAYNRALADLKLRKAEREEAKSALKAAITRLEQPVHLEAAFCASQASLAKIQTELKNLPFQLRRAIADERAARKDYESKQAAKGVVSGVEIDIAKSKLESAEALVQELHDRKASLEEEQKGLSGRCIAMQTELELLADEIEAKEAAEAKMQAAEARVEQADVAKAEAKLRLDRMTIHAPVDGRVYQLIAHPGARIGSGMNQMQGYDGSTIVTMYQPDRLQVRVDVRFADIPQVSLNQPVEIGNAALEEPIQGTVLFISSEADIQKNTLEVKVAIADPPSVFKPEMLVDVTFLAPKEPDQLDEPTQEMKLYVPKQLVQKDDAGSFVWLADQSDGVAVKVRIETGKVGNNGLVQVTQGLTVSSRLIVDVPDDLESGERIRVTGEETSLGAQRPVAGSPDNSERTNPSAREGIN